MASLRSHWSNQNRSIWSGRARPAPFDVRLAQAKPGGPLGTEEPVGGDEHIEIAGVALHPHPCGEAGRDQDLASPRTSLVSRGDLPVKTGRRKAPGSPGTG